MTTEEKRDIAKSIAEKLECETMLKCSDYKDIIILVAEYLLAWHKK